MKQRKSQLKAAFLKPYADSFGNISQACAAIKISRVIYYRWIKDDPLFKEAIDEINESFIDFAESKLYKKIQDGEWTPLKFFLLNRAKSRGWNDTDIPTPVMQHTGTIKIEITKNIIQGVAK